MKSKKFVKIRGVNNLSDARYCSGMMVDVIGFNLNSNHKDGVNIEVLKAITQWIQGPEIAGEFDDMALDLIQTYLPLVDLDIIETSNVSLLAPLIDTGKKIYLKINLDTIYNERTLLTKIKEGQIAHKIVICQSEKIKNKTLIKPLLHYTQSEQIINGFNLDLDQLDSWPAIEIMATAEEKPGFKDYGEIMDILEYIEDQE
jgi:phosphoribosylanthranilate isomerase|tara:strand:+ start:1607 stop:2209 length:603 start_codon:yes stop_codon:yes gene_type:complete